MSYRSTRAVIEDLLRHGKALVVEDEVDPHLELAEIHRRVYHNKGPALLFKNVRGTPFPVASNIFGSLERARFIFRSTFDSVQMAVRWKTNPADALRTPWQLWRAPAIGWHMQPKRVSRPAVHSNSCKLSSLPQVVCWPRDGGPFVTLPQVLSQSPGESRLRGLNLGMYRVQLAGNDYVIDQECGLHYQIHRGIGVHHTRAIELNQPFPVSITVGGTPAMTVAAVMPLPEGMSELTFAGALAGHRIPMFTASGLAPVYADADFCIEGVVEPGETKPEGPFGDHLGYYAKVHDFPVVRVKRVSYRDGAVWPITVVGRPPQEDTTFGELIHELTSPVIPTVLPGVQRVHAVDAAGVHPLLLAEGSERYTPYRKPTQPQELLTQACAILGQGQLSLAKFLFIVDSLDPSAPKATEIGAFFKYVLERIDNSRDLHFLTRTTIDTLDYSGDGFNQGSKLIVAVGREPLRELSHELPSDLCLPQGWRNPQVVMPGVLAVENEPHNGPESTGELQAQCQSFSVEAIAVRRLAQAFPLITVTDDSSFSARRFDNWLWNTFTRANPAVDVLGIGASLEHKHFGCRGSVVIDARSKPHHSDGLFEDPETVAKVDARATRGDQLAKFL